MAQTEIQSARSTLRRKIERGRHDRAIIDAILDEGLICHVGFVDHNSIFVLPMAYARVKDQLYLHGAPGNHMLRRLASGAEACVTVTLLDGLVFARSAFHHSMNYRSAVLFGRAQPLMVAEEKRQAVLAIVDHMAHGRSNEARIPTDAELRSTLVVAFPIVEGSAKVRTGGPVEEPEDLELSVWAGQLPFRFLPGEPIPDDGIGEHIPAPPYVSGYFRSRTVTDVDGVAPARTNGPPQSGG